MATVSGENRFSQITPDDHAGSVWIAALLCLVYSVLTLFLRGHLRKKMYGPDDYLALVATLLQVGEVIAVIVGLQHGLGRTQDLILASELKQASRAALTGFIFFILAAAAAKASTLCLMMRLFNLTGPRSQNEPRSRVLYWTSVGFLGGIGLWGLMSIVALSADCHAATFIRGDQGRCSRQFLRWQLITAFDVATECVLVLLSIFIVWPVQMAFYMKSQVVLAFAFRLPVAALSIVHLKFISEYAGSSNPGVAMATVLVIQQVQLCWTLIAATVPNLKSFVKSFSSGFGIQLDPDSTRAYSSGRYAGSNQYEMGSVNANAGSKSRSANRSYNDVETQTHMPHQEPDDSTDSKPTTRDQASIDSAGSQDHIIRKDVQWNIHYETDANGAQI
ncbi:hypothetical protein HRR83_007243 [Exophiala dermatitidis]|uniref:Rhodopsin domain-containing protein n=2 Tax=Exophiala dermatitidis TaxID=5970 RepID=H6C426_EXODN|nr:uncharacterized protein HMPREF1120_06402 [Exophiala dermatitidis NIH/UT8656]KAJ4509079.1 hypothetical protein HRR75_006048 [Exophiala dermatitidis]EHY58391.1 hypothetical protein HMPREF1120_06402 [Exophiala dermatitidis NIH/UT8656]KAJ4511202.1 hypothetical protein HRR73_006535 [Exophiala dermatitidis]KAJ4511863.1 hypothetical protein HRR74_006597 [Exophiala dermatitidis]KAJ4534719.1 hypothetical protein HRR76_006633 [Exophiala dermatitidis]